MRTCPSCNGIIGKDCFDTFECQRISMNMEAEYRHRVQVAQDSQVDDHYNLQYLFDLHNRLIKCLEKQGIDLSEYHKSLSDELPF